jgi:hypothetical protein
MSKKKPPRIPEKIPKNLVLLSKRLIRTTIIKTGINSWNLPEKILK